MYACMHPYVYIETCTAATEGFGTVAHGMSFRASGLLANILLC